MRLGDALALSVALANASLESRNLVEYAFSGQIRTEATRSRSELQLSGSEFASLFGASGFGGGGLGRSGFAEGDDPFASMMMMGGMGGVGGGLGGGRRRRFRDR